MTSPATSPASRRAQAKAEYDAFLAACPSRQLLDRISNKWVVLILCALSEDADKSVNAHKTPTPGEGKPQALRFSELSRRLTGVSQKMLTQTLRALERDGMLTRTATPTVPVTVHYELTDLGRSLHDVARSVRRWAQTHMDDVLAARQRYDAQANGARAHVTLDSA